MSVGDLALDPDLVEVLRWYTGLAPFTDAEEVSFGNRHDHDSLRFQTKRLRFPLYPDEPLRSLLPEQYDEISVDPKLKAALETMPRHTRKHLRRPEDQEQEGERTIEESYAPEFGIIGDGGIPIIATEFRLESKKFTPRVMFRLVHFQKRFITKS